MRFIPDSVQLTADATDIFSGRYGKRIPTWAKRIHLYWSFSDTDCTLTGTIGGVEVARATAPTNSGADNIQRIARDEVHVFIDKQHCSNDDVNIDANVTTAGVGVVTIAFEG